MLILRRSSDDRDLGYDVAKELSGPDLEHLRALDEGLHLGSGLVYVQSMDGLVQPSPEDLLGQRCVSLQVSGLSHSRRFWPHVKGAVRR